MPISAVNESKEELVIVMAALGPVQEFLMEARKVRDLWCGSYLLSRLTYAAIQPIVKNLGADAFIIPDVGSSAFFRHFKNPGSVGQNDLQVASLPNHFVFLAPKADLSPLMKAAVDATASCWQTLADDCHAFIDDKLGKGHDAWDTCWQHQVQHHFHLYWVALPTARGELEEHYRDVYVSLQQLMERRKMTRTFEQWQGNSNNKCGQCGRREVMGPEGRENIFWGAARDKSALGFKIAAGEKLCAVCLVKRIASEAKIQPGLTKVPFDSTSDIAARSFMANLTEIQGKDLQAAINTLMTALGQTPCASPADLPGDLLYIDGLTGKALKKQYSGLNMADVENATYGVRTLLKEMAQAGISPAKYYAIITLDGDDMGKWLSGVMGPAPYRMDDQKRFSENIGALAAEPLPDEIAEVWNGVVIYSGGDDLLALGPLDGCLDAANRLRKRFAERIPGATCSAGIVVTHHQLALRRALEEARDAVKRAKEEVTTLKNAFSMTVLLSSGGIIRCAVPWEYSATPVGSCDLLSHLINHLRGDNTGLSVRFIHDLFQVMPGFYSYEPGRSYPAFHAHLFTCEVKRLLERHLEKTLDNRKEVITKLSCHLTVMADTSHIEFNKSRNVTPENFQNLLRAAAVIARHTPEEY